MLTDKEWLEWVNEYNKTHHDGPRTMDEVCRLNRQAQEEETVKRILNFINGLPVPSARTYQPGAVDNAYAFGKTCTAIIKAIEQMYGLKL